MTIKNISIVVIAGIAGCIGGFLSSGRRVQASGFEIVRATGFELLNAAGAPVARWQADANDTVQISFFRHLGTGGLEMGLLEDGRPFLRMTGRDGKERIVIELGQSDKPMLGMGDERWEGRVLLGYMSPDVSPARDWDNWGLSFRRVGSERPVAGIGMVKKGRSQIEGFLTVGGKNVR